MFRKGKIAVEGDPKEGWSGIEAVGKLNKKRWGWRLFDGYPSKRRPHIFLD